MPAEAVPALVVMSIPRSPTRAAARPQARKGPRVLRSAVYVAYRRRSATGAVRVATGLADQQAR
jgi:hypothetical protein